ncbi:MAG: hypothetical protein L0H37_09750, partial [Nitrosospira sp.]|nr:hypothetical protein [Nitrosospira sp.]
MPKVRIAIVLLATFVVMQYVMAHAEHADFEREFSYQSWHAPDGALWVAHNKSLWRLPPSAHDHKALTDLFNAGEKTIGRALLHLR